VLAEDEVYGASDVAGGVYLVSGLGKERVLGAVQADAIVALLGVVGGERDGLRADAVGVLYVDVVEFGVGRVVLDGTSGLVIGGAGEETAAVHNVHDIAGVGEGVGCVAVDGEGGGTDGDDDLLGVGAREDEEALSGCRCCAKRVDRSLDLLL